MSTFSILCRNCTCVLPLYDHNDLTHTYCVMDADNRSSGKSIIIFDGERCC